VPTFRPFQGSLTSAGEVCKSPLPGDMAVVCSQPGRRPLDFSTCAQKLWSPRSQEEAGAPPNEERAEDRVQKPAGDTHGDGSPACSDLGEASAARTW
jgi:hypothetical protein